MAVYMTKDKKEIIVTCNCRCGASFHISVDDEWKEDDWYAFLCFMKGNFDAEYERNPWRAFVVKMKKIWTILRGRDYYYSDTVMNKAEFEEFKAYVNQF